MPKEIPYDPEKILEVLERHDPRFMVIGGLGARLGRRPSLVRRDEDGVPGSANGASGLLRRGWRRLASTIRRELGGS